VGPRSVGAPALEEARGRVEDMQIKEKSVGRGAVLVLNCGCLTSSREAEKKRKYRK